LCSSLPTPSAGLRSDLYVLQCTALFYCWKLLRNGVLIVPHAPALSHPYSAVKKHRQEHPTPVHARTLLLQCCQEAQEQGTAPEERHVRRLEGLRGACVAVAVSSTTRWFSCHSAHTLSTFRHCRTCPSSMPKLPTPVRPKNSAELGRRSTARIQYPSCFLLLLITVYITFLKQSADIC
jgi:hypothetical protein